MGQVDVASRAVPVTRCPVHSNPADPTNSEVPASILPHLVRSSEPAARYHTNPATGRFSLTTPVSNNQIGILYIMGETGPR